MMAGASGAEWFALAGDIAAIVTLGVAIYALSTWRKELRAQAEHDAALKCLSAARKLKEAIAIYRNPLRVAAEMTLGVTQAEAERRVLEGRNGFYLETATRDLRESAVVASILWQDEFPERLKELTSCVFELGHQTSEYLRRLTDWPNGQMVRNPFFKVAESVVMIPPKTEGPDAFGERVERAVAGLEEFLLPKLATYLQRQPTPKAENRP